MKVLAFAGLLTLCENGTGFTVPHSRSFWQTRRCHAAINSSPTTSIAPRHESPSSSSARRRYYQTAMSFWEVIQGRGVRATLAEKSPSQKSPILICPAQLSVPRDYDKMITELTKRGYPVYCADLTRVGWITGLLPSALSAEYFKGELVPVKTLEFYYKAINRALQQAKTNHPDAGVHIVGHSIGGWVARAWLAEECSVSDSAKMLSLTTLGTPNSEPGEDAGPWAAIDQTRGLLKNINARFPGAHVDSVRYTSVAGTAVKGKFPGGLEEMLAFVSYLPLSGRGEASGDGIIPRDIAVLEGSKVVELPTCKHAGFVPFPGQAIDLGEDCLWYGSPSLLNDWIGNLEEAERATKVSRRSEGGMLSGWPW